MKENCFAGLWSDFSGYVEFLKNHGITPGMKILDFGCSWGYGSYQMTKAGYDVLSNEIGAKRRDYGIKHLDVKHIDEPYAIEEGHPDFESFDCFFSSHVLEHVPTPNKIIDLAWRCLKPGGAFVAFTPNGNEAYRQFDPQGWHNMWGAVHPNFLDRTFYEKQFSNSKHIFSSRDGTELDEQYELGFVAWKDVGKTGF